MAAVLLVEEEEAAFRLQLRLQPSLLVTKSQGFLFQIDLAVLSLSSSKTSLLLTNANAQLDARLHLCLERIQEQQ